MKDFQIFFTADSLPYRTTVYANTDGQAQDKFSKWFTDKFKPERGIVGIAKVTKIVPIDREKVTVKSLMDYFKLWKTN